MKKIFFLAVSAALVSQGALFGADNAVAIPNAIPQVKIPVIKSKSFVNKVTAAGALAGAIGGAAAAGHFFDWTKNQGALAVCGGALLAGSLSRYIAASYTPEKMAQFLCSQAIDKANDARMLQPSNKARTALGRLDLSYPAIPGYRKAVYEGLNKKPLGACNEIGSEHAVLVEQNKRIDDCKGLDQSNLLANYGDYLSDRDKDAVRNRCNSLQDSIRAFDRVKTSNQRLISLSATWLSNAEESSEVVREKIENDIAQRDLSITYRESDLCSMMGWSTFGDGLALVTGRSKKREQYANLDKAQILGWYAAYREMLSARNRRYIEWLRVDKTVDSMFNLYANDLGEKKQDPRIDGWISSLETMAWVNSVVR